MRVRFWGVRGTIPVPGKDTLRVGGNTSCVDVITSDNELIIIDAGSGIRNLEKALRMENKKHVRGTILIGHTHWDHIHGFPYFKPIFVRNNRFVIVGPKKKMGAQLEAVLAGQIVEPYLPFSYNALPADLHVKEVEGGEVMVLADNTVVHVEEMNHPGGCLGFRVENSGHVFAYCTDTKHPDDGSVEPGVLALAQGADLMVHDAQFSLEERAMFSDWGHSSWREAALAAKAADVGCLALSHHAPDSTDDYLENVVLKQARELFPRTILAREGMALELPVPPSLWEDN